MGFTAITPPPVPQGPPLTTGAPGAFPSSPVDGERYIDTAGNFFYFIGGSWRQDENAPTSAGSFLAANTANKERIIPAAEQWVFAEMDITKLSVGGVSLVGSGHANVTRAGHYYVTARSTAEFLGTGYGRIRVITNLGSPAIRLAEFHGHSDNGTIFQRIEAEDVIYLAAGDTLYVQVTASFVPFSFFDTELFLFRVGD